MITNHIINIDYKTNELFSPNSATTCVFMCEKGCAMFTKVLITPLVQNIKRVFNELFHFWTFSDGST